MINITSLVAGIAEQTIETVTQEPNIYLIASVGLAAIGSLAAYVYNQRASQNGQLQTLNLSFNQLEAPPDVSQNAQLQTLELSSNRLVAPPDVSQNGQLHALNLSSNRLVAPPDLSQNARLTYLYLSNNQLVAPPDVRQNAQLINLYLSSNQLEAPPDVRQNAQLQTLELSSNRLVAPPDVSQNGQLQTLNLSFNQLEAPPDVSQNAQLRILNLFGNQLVAPPDVSQNAQLQSLQLSGNQLAVSPDVSQNPQLRMLYLSGNQLTELHDSILSLSRECRVDVQFNLLTPEYIAAFQERLRVHRLAHPDQGPTVRFSIHDDVAPAGGVSLEEQLALWSQEFEETFPQEERLDLWASRQGPGANLQEHFGELHSLEPETKTMLANYLRRLRDIKDYENGGEGKKNTILRVERMLQLANKNPVFRQELLHLLEQALVSCGDRVQLYFDEIEIAWQFHQRELSPEEFRDLIIRAERCRQLQLYAEKKAQELGLGDEIETILYYRIHLREALNLPISTLNMLYPGVSGVSAEMIGVARDEISALTDEQLLATSSRWQEHIKKLHEEEVEKITNHYGNLLNDLGDYFDLENQEDKDQYLEQRPDLASLIGKAISLNISVEYSAMAGFISEERQAKIAELG